MSFDLANDAELSTFLETAGLPADPGRFRTLVARAAASPETYPADAWMRVLGAAPERLSAETRDALRRLRAESAAAGTEAGLRLGDRLGALRKALEKAGVDGMILPRADEHQGEYIPEQANRLQWLTGFTGSAGVAVVLRDQAVLFVDGRYTLQASQQLDAAHWTSRHLIDSPPSQLIAEAMQGGKLGYDPRLHSIQGAARLREAVEKTGGSLVPLTPNPIDALWRDRPGAPLSPVEVLSTATTGESAAAKRARIGAAIKRAGADATALNAAESVAWLLNIRGQDVPNTPLPLSYVTVTADGTVDLFIDPAKLDGENRAALGNEVAIRPFEEIGRALNDLGAAGAKVLLDPALATDWMRVQLEEAGATILRGEDPCTLPRAIKNAVEICGIRAAHARDAVAMTRFLRWVDETAPSEQVTETIAVDALEGFRSQGDLWRGPSFSTISGSGPNGAIVHYRVTPESDRSLKTGELYLVDSGAQYLDGTTDITRTIAIGEPTLEMRERFTLVLKGHIAIATARFPAGVAGSHLDALARQYLWKAGQDFDHGTGHGVGSFLGVHEGPQRISRASTAPIVAGMLLSNEPGYYKPDGYGIRIENLILAVEAAPMEDSGREMIAFETVTFAPIDRRLILPSLLVMEEIAWLDAYHAQVRGRVSPFLDDTERAWLEEATAPLEME